MRKSWLFVLLMIFLALSGCQSNQKVEVTFETNGGTPIEMITSITQLRDGMPTTTKEGFTFEGWYTDETLTQAFDPLENRSSWVLTIYAKWTPQNKVYQVAHYQETLTSGAFELIETEDVSGSVGQNVTITAKTYTGFTYKSSHADGVASGTIPATGTLTLKAYYTRNSYTITIDEKGGQAVSDITLKYGAPVLLPVLSRTGYTFSGYDTVITNMGASNITVTAIWEAIPQYTVTFDSKGGSAVAAQTVYEDETLTLPTPPTKLGYQFDGWVKQGGSATYVFTLPVTESFVLEARWNPITVNYQTEIYTETLTGTYTLNQTIAGTGLTEAVVTAGTVNLTGFVENETHANRVITGTILGDGSLVLKRYYDRVSSTISFVISDATVSSITQKYETVVNPPTAPTKLGYTFGAWYTDEARTQVYTFTTMPLSGLTLYGTWVPAMSTFKTEIYIESLSGGYTLLETHTEDGMTESSVAAKSVTMAGFFENTTHAQRLISGIVIGDGSLVLKRYYDRFSYAITFESNANLSISNLTAKFGETISQPTNPIRTGYHFDGWFTDIDLTQAYVFTTMPANNFTLYAKWTGESMTLHFDTQSGSPVSSITAPYNSVITPPNAPTKLGYVFAGWYTNTDYQTPFTTWLMPLGNVTVYAKWTHENYTITFITNGGSSVNPLTAPYLSSIVQPTMPTKEEHVFLGWFSDETLETAYTFDVMPLNGITLYAKWAALEDGLSLELIKSLDVYTVVKVEAQILLMPGMMDGFYIADGTTTMYVLYYDENLIEGDSIAFDATITTINGVKMLGRVENLVLTDTTFPETPAEILTIDEINALDSSHQGMIIQTQGVRMGDPLGLIDYDTQGVVYITDAFNYWLFNDFSSGLVDITAILHIKDDQWVLAAIDAVISPIDTEDMELKVTTYLDDYFARDYYSKDAFELVLFDPWHFANIEYMDTPSWTMYYDPLFKRFNMVTEPQQVVIEAEVTIWGDYSIPYQVTIELLPHDPISIETFILDVSTEPAVVSGLITMAEPDESIYVIFDGFNYLYIQGELDVNYGDMIEVLIYPYDYAGMKTGDYRKHDYCIILSENNVIPTAVPMSIDTLNPLSASLIGSFVELRGFLTNDAEIEFHGLFGISDGTHTIPIRPASYSGFESLFQYQGLEVIVRGYLAYEDGQVVLLYAGERAEVQIPTYTDEARVQMIYTVFSNQYGNREFEAYEPFELRSYHEYLGGHISYTFLEGGEYYDFEHHYFKFAYTDQVIKIEITISIEDVSFTFIYETVLKKPVIHTIESFKAGYYGENLYVEGTVVYRNPYFAYIQDDTGLLMIDSYDLPFYTGDHVVLRGQVYKEYPEYVNVSLYVDDENDQEIPLLVYMVDRDQTTVMGFKTLTWPEVMALDHTETTSYHQNIMLEGYLTSDEDIYYLGYGPYVIEFYTVDEYTQNKLLPHVDSYVSIALMITGYDWGKFEYLFLGNEGSVQPVNYTTSETVDMVKDWIDALWSQTIYGDQNLPTMPEPYGISITYETAPGFDEPIDWLFSYVYPVLEATTVDVIATFTVEDVVYTHTVTITIEATPSSGLQTIADARTLLGQPLTIETIVFANFEFDFMSYGSIVYDGVDYLIIRYPVGNYIYGDSYIGQTIIMTGVMTYNQGRYIFDVSKYNFEYDHFDFEMLDMGYPLEVIYTVDPMDDALLGMFAELWGTLEYENGHYQVTHNGMSVRLEALYDTEYFLAPFLGFEVRIKGVVLGRASDGSDALSVVVSHYQYLSFENNFMLGSYEYFTIVNLLADQLLANRYDEPYMPGDYIYFTTYSQAVPEAVITYEAVNPDPEVYMEVHDTEWIYFGAYTDKVIWVEMTVTLGDDTATRLFPIELKGITPSNFEDLFDSSVPMDEISLIATVIYEGFEYAYYEIEGNIYYYHGYLGGYHGRDEVVILNGKKSIIDGVVNYSYNVSSSSQYHETPINYDVIQMSIEDIYNIDLDSQDIRKVAIHVMGKLGYDSFLNYFTLTDDFGNTIYIRHNLEDEHEWKMGGSTSATFLHRYIGDYIDIELFYPNITTKYDQVLMDFLGDSSNVFIPEWSLEERFDIVESKIKDQFDGKAFEPGVYLNFPSYDEIHSIQLTYAQTNPLVAGVFINEWMAFTQLVDVQTTISITATMSIFNMMTETYDTDTFEFSILVNPYTVSTIYDVLFGVTGDMYTIEGIIEAIDPTTFMILNDGYHRIYIEMPANIDLPSLSIGDEVRILGNRNLYDFESYIPVIDDIFDIQVLSSDSPINTAYTSMDMADILAIDYLSPDVYNQPVTLTGVVIFTGNTWYPCFDIVIDGTYPATYSIEMKGQDYDAFNALMEPLVGETIRIEGYLIGFTYIYDLFDWKVVVLQTTVIS